jgi:hypothetical protein
MAFMSVLSPNSSIEFLRRTAVREQPDFKPAIPRSPIDDVLSWPKADPVA